MRVEILTLQAGPHGVRHPGDECDVSNDDGKALVAGGYAREISAKRRRQQTGSVMIRTSPWD